MSARYQREAFKDFIERYTTGLTFHNRAGNFNPENNFVYNDTDKCQDQDEYQLGRFKGAIYKYINYGLYIENKDGKCYDTHTLELRGWYNPYLLKYKWL